VFAFYLNIVFNITHRINKHKQPASGKHETYEWRSDE